MRINNFSILSHRIIGLRAKILESPDLTLRGSEGTLVYETKNTIYIKKDSSSVIQVPKKVARKIELQTGSCACFISGSSLIGKPEDRISRLKNG
jgi:RNase P/RNase MRP subunit p29